MTREDPRPGRPRDPETDQAILRAALQLLTDRGYAGMSVEGVASRAGVGKTTIYRRYASKEELVAAALAALRDDLGPLPDTGDIRSDMVEMILQMRRALQQGPGLGMIGALLVEERRSPELLELLRANGSFARAGRRRSWSCNAVWTGGNPGRRRSGGSRPSHGGGGHHATHLRRHRIEATR